MRRTCHGTIPHLLPSEAILPTIQHQVVKPQKLVSTAVGMLEQELLIPNLFQKQGVDQFKGAENDTISMKIEGILPFHDYVWRNDRPRAIAFDEYAERTIAVTFGGNVYLRAALGPRLQTALHAESFRREQVRGLPLCD